MVNNVGGDSLLWDTALPGQVIMSYVRNLCEHGLVSQKESCIHQGFSGTYLIIKWIPQEKEMLCGIASKPVCKFLFEFPP